jgi:non-heme chloroperoxidase
MPFVPVRDGKSLYVRVVGRGAPVLMLPGLGMNSAHWLPFVLPHSLRHRFYMPDFRGFGRSRHVRLNQADVFENHAEDVRDVIAHFGLRDYALAGISLGGSTALHMHRASGFDGVRRYLHIDQSPCVGNREGWSHGLFGAQQDAFFDTLRDVHRLLEAHPHARHLDELPGAVRVTVAGSLATIAGQIGGKTRVVPIVKRALLMPRAVASRMPLSHLDDVRAYLRAYLAGGHDYRESLRTCTTPVTVMVGMRSPLYPPEGQLAIATYAPNARVVRFEASGHVPLVDEPSKFVRELGRFLAEG